VKLLRGIHFYITRIILRGFARKEMTFYKEASKDFTKALEFNPNDYYLSYQ